MVSLAVRRGSIHALIGPNLDGELVEHPRSGAAGQGRARAAGLELGVDDAVGAAEEEAPGTVVIGLDQEPSTLEVLDLASGVSR